MLFYYFLWQAVILNGERIRGQESTSIDRMLLMLWYDLPYLGCSPSDECAADSVALFSQASFYFSRAEVS